MQANVVSRLLGVVICLLILHGCSQAPERTLPPTDDPLSERAAESMAAGAFLAAANLSRQLASTTTDPALRRSYLLAAAEAAAQGGDWDGVRESVALL